MTSKRQSSSVFFPGHLIMWLFLHNPKASSRSTRPRPKLKSYVLITTTYMFPLPKSKVTTATTPGLADEICDLEVDGIEIVYAIARLPTRSRSSTRRQAEGLRVDGKMHVSASLKVSKRKEQAEAGRWGQDFQANQNLKGSLMTIDEGQIIG
ncbi:hypothetical protein Tco_1530858 [Tanacetum coccineum]